MPRQQPAWWADIERLHGEGLADAEIAARLNRRADTVYYIRKDRLGLPKNVPSGSTVYSRHDTRPGCNQVVSVHKARPAWYSELFVMWALGMSDREIAHVVGQKPGTVWRARTRGLKLPPNFTPGGRPSGDDG